MADLHRLIGTLQSQQVSLQLDTTDLCFLVALHVKSQGSTLASLDEELLFDVFEQVCEVTDPGAGNPRQRANHALQRMREQRLLGRVDGAGLVKAGEYAITRLGTAIVEFWLQEEGLTRESLALLTRTLRSQLAEVKASCRVAASPEHWRLHVVEPLKVTVRELVGGIERRQRGMDAQQEEVRTRIGELLQRDWFTAVDACEDLLQETAATLRELHEVLLRDTTQLQNLLGEIEALAGEAGVIEAEDAVRAVSDQVERVAAWGGARLEAWSDYFQFVQRYLRSVVRLDPQRAVSQRLRDALAAWPGSPYRLVAAEPTHLRLMREPDVRSTRPAVARPPEERDREPAEVATDPSATPLDEVVREVLAEGASSLSEVVRRVLARTDAGPFPTAGRVAEVVGREARVSSAREREWVALEGLEIEEWSLGG